MSAPPLFQVLVTITMAIRDFFLFQSFAAKLLLLFATPLGPETSQVPRPLLELKVPTVRIDAGLETAFERGHPINRARFADVLPVFFGHRDLELRHVGVLLRQKGLHAVFLDPYPSARVWAICVLFPADNVSPRTIRAGHENRGDSADEESPTSIAPTVSKSEGVPGALVRADMAAERPFSTTVFTTNHTEAGFPGIECDGHTIANLPTL